MRKVFLVGHICLDVQEAQVTDETRQRGVKAGMKIEGGMAPLPPSLDMPHVHCLKVRKVKYKAPRLQ